MDKSPSDKMSDFCPLGLLSYDRTGPNRSRQVMTDQDMLGLVRTGKVRACQGALLEVPQVTKKDLPEPTQETKESLCELSQETNKLE